MPLLDVSDVLLDPMFCVQLSITRRAATVGTDGLAIITDTTLTPHGVVTAGSVEPFVRDPDFEHAKNNITVHAYNFRLLDPTDGYQPDIVNYEGNQYVVRKSYNWSSYGAGFTAADCEMLGLVNAQ